MSLHTDCSAFASDTRKSTRDENDAWHEEILLIGISVAAAAGIGSSNVAAAAFGRRDNLSGDQRGNKISRQGGGDVAPDCVQMNQQRGRLATRSDRRECRTSAPSRHLPPEYRGYLPPKL